MYASKSTKTQIVANSFCHASSQLVDDFSCLKVSTAAYVCWIFCFSPVIIVIITTADSLPNKKEL